MQAYVLLVFGPTTTMFGYFIYFFVFLYFLGFIFVLFVLLYFCVCSLPQVGVIDLCLFCLIEFAC